MKQAYLITAYKNFDELYELAEILSKTAYVFIHVDEKSREITDADKPYYFKDRKFDEEAWAKINGK